MRRLPRFFYHYQRFAELPLLRYVLARQSPALLQWERAGGRAALSPCAEDRPENTTKSATQAATWRCAGSSSSSEATKYGAENPAKAALLPARAPRQMTGYQHDQDRQHLVQKRRVETAALRGMVRDVAANILGAEDTPEQLIAPIDLRRLGAQHVSREVCAAKGIYVGIQLRRIVSHAAQDRGQQRLSSALSLLARYSKLGSQCFNAASWQ
jgi:hypothetical protein